MCCSARFRYRPTLPTPIRSRTITDAILPPLAHAGEGASWQALIVTVAGGVAVVFLLAAAGRLRLERGDDLVLPLAVVAIISAVAPAASGTLSDQVGWAFPAGLSLLLALLVAATTDLELGVTSWLTWTAVAVAVVAAVALHGPLTEAWHPPPEAGTAAAAFTGR